MNPEIVFAGWNSADLIESTEFIKNELTKASTSLTKAIRNFKSLDDSGEDNKRRVVLLNMMIPDPEPMVQLFEVLEKISNSALAISLMDEECGVSCCGFKRNIHDMHCEHPNDCDWQPDDEDRRMEHVFNEIVKARFNQIQKGSKIAKMMRKVIEDHYNEEGGCEL